MTRTQLIEEIFKKRSFLCVGLDTDISKIPAFLLDHPDPVAEFNRQIIAATSEFCVAYKPNIAFYECMGEKGWGSLADTVSAIPKNIFSIADAKRGDIGNTAEMYARTFFQTYNFESVTVAPYMGKDSVTPFLGFKEKWAIVLALTSNPGAEDFQFFRQNERYLFQHVLETSKQWGSEENMMYVAGATRGSLLKEVRKIVPEHFLLVPGVGAQGGSLDDVCKNAFSETCGLLVNSSRGIIYAGKDQYFAEQAAEEAKKLQKEMSAYF